MTMKTKYIIIAIFAVVLTPIMLNVFLGASNPLSNIEVVGSEVDWLAFYASYIGGLLTALIGFITLYKEAKRNRLLLEIRSKEDALKELKLALTERIGMFEYSKVIEIALFPYDTTMYTTLQRELSEYYYQLTSKANAWGTIYASSTQEEVVKFKDIYMDCYEMFIEKINSVTQGIYYLANPKTEKGNKLTEEDLHKYRKDMIDKYITPASECSSRACRMQKMLFSAAQAWISAEEREIAQLKAKL